MPPNPDRKSQEMLLAEVAENLRYLNMRNEDIEKRGLDKNKLYARAYELFKKAMLQTSGEYQDVIRRGYLEILRKVPVTDEAVDEIMNVYESVMPPQNATPRSAAFVSLMRLIADMSCLPRGEWDKPDTRTMVFENLISEFHHFMLVSYPPESIVPPGSNPFTDSYTIGNDSYYNHHSRPSGFVVTDDMIRNVDDEVAAWNAVVPPGLGERFITLSDSERTPVNPVVASEITDRATAERNYRRAVERSAARFDSDYEEGP